ncbi:GumK N-terminal domain-containing glycosyltransferase [Anaerosinus sp.]|uniref:GumK N-terminal domain-containing glycosyltransferase n=1 Tax=Selenobaculum sp. TaxID=3074374 RepID=UPI003AB5B46A
MKKALLANCNYWGNSTFLVGSNHIARCLVEDGWQVGFVSAAISPLHLLGGLNKELKERIKLNLNGGIWYNNHLWAYVPMALFTPKNCLGLKSKFVHDKYYKFTFPNVIQKVKEAGFGEVDLLCIDNVMQDFWIRHIKYRKSVFRITDKHTGFSNINDEAILEKERSFAKNVDYVAYTAKSLKNYVDFLSPKSAIYMPNSVNFSHFHCNNYKVPEDLLSIPRPIAIYVGAISEWFDYKLLREAAIRMPNISFVLIGPDNIAKKNLNKISNVYILGRKNYIDIPQYLYSADVGIIPFNVKDYGELVHGVNPLKLYEYMACGLPVIAAKWQAIEQIDSPAFLYDNINEFIKNLQRGINEKTMRKKIYIDFAKKHDWKEMVGEFLREIGL